MEGQLDVSRKELATSGEWVECKVLQTIQIELILLYAWAEPAVLCSPKTALEFRYEI